MMKKTMKSALVLMMLLITMSYVPERPEVSVNYYVLLDRNSKTIDYYENPKSKGPYEDQYYAFIYTTECHSGVTNETGKSPSKQLPRITKPICFLDSVKYYDEQWLRENYIKKTFETGGDTAVHFIIMDKSTIRNDSITLFYTRYFEVHID